MKKTTQTDAAMFAAQIEKRKLVEKLAAKVMGWHVLNKTTQYPNAKDGGIYFLASHGIKRQWLDDYGSTDCFWDPLTKKADALDLLDRCLEYATITIIRGETTGVYYLHAKPQETTPLHGDCLSAEAQTFEEAICRFADVLSTPKLPMRGHPKNYATKKSRALMKKYHEA